MNLIHCFMKIDTQGFQRMLKMKCHRNSEKPIKMGGKLLLPTSIVNAYMPKRVDIKNISNESKI